MANVRNGKTQLRVNCPDAISDIDALEPIQSQYAASRRITSLLVKKAALLDPGKDIVLWYDGVFNPRTAQGAGLDVWGRIVGIGRKLWMLNADFFGFAGQNLQNFDHAPFWIRSLASGQISLSDETYRFIVFYKAMANIGESTIDAVNALLGDLFKTRHGAGSCHVLEDRPMHLRAVFSFYLTEFERSLFAQFGLLNRPAGVGFGWYSYDPGELFGFAGQDLQNFDNGVFTPYQYQETFPEAVFGFAGQNLQPFDHGGFIPAVQTA